MKIIGNFLAWIVTMQLLCEGYTQSLVFQEKKATTAFSGKWWGYASIFLPSMVRLWGQRAPCLSRFVPAILIYVYTLILFFLFSGPTIQRSSSRSQDSSAYQRRDIGHRRLQHHTGVFERCTSIQWWGGNVHYPQLRLWRARTIPLRSPSGAWWKAYHVWRTGMYLIFHTSFPSIGFVVTWNLNLYCTGACIVYNAVVWKIS
jgi:hypothetical protein